MNVKRVEGCVDIVYTNDGAISSISFLPKKKDEVKVTIVDNSKTNIMMSDEKIAVLGNPTVTIRK